MHTHDDSGSDMGWVPPGHPLLLGMSCKKYQNGNWYKNPWSWSGSHLATPLPWNKVSKVETNLIPGHDLPPPPILFPFCSSFFFPKKRQEEDVYKTILNIDWYGIRYILCSPLHRCSPYWLCWQSCLWMCEAKNSKNITEGQTLDIRNKIGIYTDFGNISPGHTSSSGNIMLKMPEMVLWQNFLTFCWGNKYSWVGMNIHSGTTVLEWSQMKLAQQVKYEEKN